MKPLDILKLQANEYKNIELDIKSASTLKKAGHFEKAGEKYRDIAKGLLKIKLNSFAIDYYLEASESFVNSKNYEKAINTELSIYQIHKIGNSYHNMAGTYEKIASFYKYYLKNNNSAGFYYFMSAKHHEANQNYLSAFKKAKFACECFGETNNLKSQRDANSLAFRMAMQANYLERAGIYAKKWLELMPKDYSPHYISICMKGYKAFLGTDRTEEALMFVNEIIIANYEKNKPQERIIKYLTEAQKLHIIENKSTSEYYNQKIILEYGADINDKIKYSIVFKSFAHHLGLEDVADKFYLQEKQLNKALAKEKQKYVSYLIYIIWEYSCNYGTSLVKWLGTSALIIIIFGALYAHYNILLPFSEDTKHLLQNIKPSIKVSSVNNWFSPYYYSVVTLATLGYGDITPSDLSGQIFSVIEVIIGYLMLGGLLSVFSKKVIR